MSTAIVRDLVLPTSGDLERVRQTVSECVRAWRSQWAQPGADDLTALDVQVEEASLQDIAMHAWRPLREGCAGAWLPSGPQGKEPMRDLVIGRPAAGAVRAASDLGWGTVILTEAHEDLVTRLAGHLASQHVGMQVDAHASQATPLCRPYDGLLKIGIPALGWQLLLDGNRLASMRMPRQGVARAPVEPVALTEIVQKDVVKIELLLGETEAALGDLLVLRAGDVIRFPTLLKDALPVRIEGQVSGLEARIGSCAGRKAVSFAEPPPAPAAMPSTAAPAAVPGKAPQSPQPPGLHAIPGLPGFGPGANAAQPPRPPKPNPASVGMTSSFKLN